MKRRTLELTERQRRFVEAYLVLGVGTRAALVAGYSVHTAQQIAANLVRKPHVAAAIRAGRNAQESESRITAERVLKELAWVAFSDLAGVARWGPDGVSLAPDGKVAAADAAAVAALSVQATRWALTTRIRLQDKQAALDALARYLGLYGTRHAKLTDPRAALAESGAALALVRERVERLERKNGARAGEPASIVPALRPRPRKSTLNPRQRRFVAEYLILGIGSQAAIRAGYAPGSASQTAWSLLSKPAVADAVRAGRTARAARSRVSAERVLEELARIAFADWKGIARWTADSVSLKPDGEVSADDRAAISGIWVRATRRTLRTRIRLHDKQKALGALARYLDIGGRRGTAPDPSGPAGRADGVGLARLRRKLGLPAP